MTIGQRLYLRTPLPVWYSVSATLWLCGNWLVGVYTPAWPHSVLRAGMVLSALGLLGTIKAELPSWHGDFRRRFTAVAALRLAVVNAAGLVGLWSGAAVSGGTSWHAFWLSGSRAAVPLLVIWGCVLWRAMERHDGR